MPCYQTLSDFSERGLGIKLCNTVKLLIMNPLKSGQTLDSRLTPINSYLNLLEADISQLRTTDADQ